MPCMLSQLCCYLLCQVSFSVGCMWLLQLHASLSRKFAFFVFVNFCVVKCSVLWCCWLGGRKSIWPVKTEWWNAGVVICLERNANLHMGQLMPLPITVSCFSKIQIGFTFLVPAHPGSPGQRAVKRVVCVCVCVCVTSVPLLRIFMN